MVNWKRTIMASAGGGSEDGWFTRYGDPTLNTGGYNYFGSMSVEYNKENELPNSSNVYFDEPRDTLWCGIVTRYIGDNNGSPSGQATSGVAAFNGTDGSYGSYAATQTWGNTVSPDGGYALMELSSNKLGVTMDKGQQVSAFNTANRAWDSAIYVDNSAKAIKDAAPVRVGNDFVAVGNGSRYVGYYNTNTLIPTGSRKYSNDNSNSNGQYPLATSGVAGTSGSNWFGGAYNASTSSYFVLLKYNYNSITSGKYISTGDAGFFGSGNAIPTAMLADSNHVYWFWRQSTGRYIWIFKFDHSLNIVKSVKFQQAGSNGNHRIRYPQFGADGNIHMFQGDSWTRSDEPVTRIIIDKDLTTIKDYIRVWHKPQGTYNTYNAGGVHGVVLDSRDNAYFGGQGQLTDPAYYFGGQGTIGKYFCAMKLPYNFSSTGTYDTTSNSNATYWGDNEIVIDKPSIPTVSTETNPTLSNYTNLSFANENTNNNHNYSYSFTRDSTALASYSSNTLKNVSIT